MYIHGDSISTIPQKQFIIIINNVIQTNVSHLSSRNTFNMRGSPSFSKRGSSNNQYIHYRYNPQQDPLNKDNQQGQHSYPVRPTKPFNTYQENKGNSDKANSDMDI